MNSRLSHRLQTIHNHTPLNPNIYDVGCDHGQLGLSFSVYPEVENIFLVDPSQEVIDSLKAKLTDADIPKQASIIQKKANQLEIKTKKNTLIMCGFGGTQMQEGLMHLKPQMDSDSIFVLSPHRHTLELREYLAREEFDLLSDQWIIENGQFYPLIVVGNSAGRGVHPFGEKNLWQTPVGAQYREYVLKMFKEHKDPLDQRFYRYLESI